MSNKDMERTKQAEDMMKVAHGTNRLTLAINKEFDTELTRSTLRSNGNLELLWLDPGILIVLSIDTLGDLSIGWVRPNTPSAYYLDIQERLEKTLSTIGDFVGVVDRGV